MQRPFDLIRDVFRESNQQNKELLKYVFEKSDGITLWVIGIAVGGISIIINNIANVKSQIQPDSLHAILILLSICVSAGLTYRSSFLYYFVRLSHTARGIDIALSTHALMDTEPNLNGNETFSELLQKVREGFGDDLTHLIPLYSVSSEEDKVKLYNSVVVHYIKSVDFAKRDMEAAFDFVAETYANLTGSKKQKTLDAMQAKQTFFTDFKVLVICSIFYCIYIASFLSALFLFAFNS